MYEKETQTSDHMLSASEQTPTSPSGTADLEQQWKEREDQLRRMLMQDEFPRLLEAELKKRQQKAAEKQQHRLIEPPSEEERSKLVTSQRFVSFIDQASKVMERALNEDYDIMRDYRLATDQGEASGAGKRVTLLKTYYSDRWCKNRNVTDVDASHKFPELTLASYNKNQHQSLNASSITANNNDPDGLVLVWNLHLPDRPEFIFYSQSEVTTARFSPFHPNLIVGGTYSGQILLWDTRAHSAPVLKSPLTASGHTHPIYSLSVVGTQNAHNLVSSSTDGLICSWQLDMLAKPIESLPLLHQSHSAKTEEVSTTVIQFPPNETVSFWVGTEEGTVYQANRYDRAGSKAGLFHNDTYSGHFGAITGMHFHPPPSASSTSSAASSIDFSDLLVTSSTDWTVKLWKRTSINLNKVSTQPQTIVPLMSFETASDYVLDVKWAPHHPAVFASCTGNGTIEIWNLNASTEVPVQVVHVSDTGSSIVGADASSATSSTNVQGVDQALNKLTWNVKGDQLSVGTASGRVHVFDVGDLSLVKPAEDPIKFQKVIHSRLVN